MVVPEGIFWQVMAVHIVFPSCRPALLCLLDYLVKGLPGIVLANSSLSRPLHALRVADSLDSDDVRRAGCFLPHPGLNGIAT